MAAPTLPVSFRDFSTSEDEVDFTRRRPAWPASIRQDQAAIDQARRELGPDADPKQILARAQQIKREVNRG